MNYDVFIYVFRTMGEGIYSCTWIHVSTELCVCINISVPKYIMEVVK